MAIHVYGPAMAPPVEYTRWTLDRMGVPYRFERAAAGLSAFKSWRLRVPIELPLLMIDREPHGGFRAAYEELHGRIAGMSPRPEPRLDPAQVDDLMANAFGQAVRCFYRTMLGHPELLKPLATDQMPFLHRFFIERFYPVWRWMMTKGLRLDATSPGSDLASIRGVFERIASRLDRKPFLAGDAPGGEDVLFAAIASAVVLPPGHPQALPPVETLPEPLKGHVAAFRATAAGQLAMRVYEYRTLPLA